MLSDILPRMIEPTNLFFRPEKLNAVRYSLLAAGILMHLMYQIARR